jgi:hypothetical protein
MPLNLKKQAQAHTWIFEMLSVEHESKLFFFNIAGNITLLYFPVQIFYILYLISLQIPQYMIPYLVSLRHVLCPTLFLLYVNGIADRPDTMYVCICIRGGP